MGSEQNGPGLVDVLAALKDARDQDTNPEDELLIITDWTVKSDGRLTIPKDKREKYDIEEGENLDGILVVNSG